MPPPRTRAELLARLEELRQERRQRQQGFAAPAGQEEVRDIGAPPLGEEVLAEFASAVPNGLGERIMPS